MYQSFNKNIMQHNVGLWKRPTLQHAHHFRKKYLTKNIFFKYWQALNPKLFSFMNVSERSDTEQWSQWPVHAHTFSSPQPLLTPHFPFSKSDLDFFQKVPTEVCLQRGPTCLSTSTEGHYELRAQTPMRAFYTLSGLSGLPHEHLRLSYS